MKTNLFLSLIILVLANMLSCTKDSNKVLISPKIIEVEDNFKLNNGTTIKVNVIGNNINDNSVNKFFVDSTLVNAYLLPNEVAYKIELPMNTFSSNKMSSTLSFFNGLEFAEIDLYAEGFPLLEPLPIQFTYPNEKLRLEGKNLWFNENSQVHFITETGTVKAEIIKGDNFKLDVMVPDSAISGPIIYTTHVNEENNYRAFNFGVIEIRK